MSYLRQRGVLTILVVAQHGFLGSNMIAPIDVSYLADTVVLTRYFEATAWRDMYAKRGRRAWRSDCWSRALGAVHE